MSDNVRHVVKNTPKVPGFVGAGAKPSPLSREEVDQILNQVTEGCRPLHAPCDGGGQQRKVGADSRHPRRLLRVGRRRGDGKQDTDDRDRDESGSPAFNEMQGLRCMVHGVFLLAHGGGKRGGNLETADNGVEFAEYWTSSRYNHPAAGVAGRR